jgi:hypothetical protein
MEQERCLLVAEVQGDDDLLEEPPRKALAGAAGSSDAPSPSKKPFLRKIVKQVPAAGILHHDAQVALRRKHLHAQETYYCPIIVGKHNRGVLPFVLEGTSVTPRPIVPSLLVSMMGVAPFALDCSCCRILMGQVSDESLQDFTAGFIWLKILL